MSGYANINDLDQFASTTKRYGGNADDSVSEVRSHTSRMEPMGTTGLIGAAGTRNQAITASGAVNVAHMARQVFEKAKHLAEAGSTLVHGDEDGMQTQNASLSAAEGLTPQVTKTITAAG